MADLPLEAGRDLDHRLQHFRSYADVTRRKSASAADVETIGKPNWQQSSKQSSSVAGAKKDVH
jgi:hypothetical protein